MPLKPSVRCATATITWGVIAALASTTACAHQRGHAKHRAFDRARDLSGAWTLNRTLSDAAAPGDTPIEHLVITLRADSVTFYDADGSWRIYRLTGRRERHDSGAVVVLTKTAWDGSILRQEVARSRDLRFVQTFTVDRRTRQLIVTTSPDARRLPMNTVRLVYDPIIDRSP
jgi:hypothetical protein